MTRTCLLLLAVLGLAACNKDKAAEGNQAFSDEDFTQGAIVANDVTAIDAATGDAANMAADVPPDETLGKEGEEEGGAATTSNRAETRASRRPARAARGAGERNEAAPAAVAPAAAAPAAPAGGGNTAG